jgi:hypothetical protein
MDFQLPKYFIASILVTSSKKKFGSYVLKAISKVIFDDVSWENLKNSSNCAYGVYS